MPGTLISEMEKAIHQCLQVVDSRTGKPYAIPIYDGGYIRAADVAQITAADTSNSNGDTSKANGYTGADGLRPLRILDNGFQHTACMVSSISFVYAIARHHSSL